MLQNINTDSLRSYLIYMIEHKKNDPKEKNIKANVSSSFSNRIIFFKQKYLRWAAGNRDTGTHFSAFIFRRRTCPTQVSCAFSGRPPWVTDPASEHPRGPAGMGLRSSKVPVLGTTSRKNSKCSGTMGVTSLSPGFGLLCAASLGGWFSSVWGCIEQFSSVTRLHLVPFHTRWECITCRLRGTGLFKGKQAFKGLQQHQSQHIPMISPTSSSSYREKSRDWNTQFSHFTNPHQAPLSERENNPTRFVLSKCL